MIVRDLAFDKYFMCYGGLSHIHIVTMIFLCSFLFLSSIKIVLENEILSLESVLHLLLFN